MKPWQIIINDFCHDMFTGIWFGSFITLVVFRLQAVEASVEIVSFISEMNLLFFWLCMSSLVLIAITGALRSTYYKNWDSEAMKSVKDRLLVVKHAILGTTMLIGSLLALVWHF